MSSSGGASKKGRAKGNSDWKRARDKPVGQESTLVTATSPQARRDADRCLLLLGEGLGLRDTTAAAMPRSLAGNPDVVVSPMRHGRHITTAGALLFILNVCCIKLGCQVLH